jgi:hypothetical protein
MMLDRLIFSANGLSVSAKEALFLPKLRTCRHCAGVDLHLAIVLDHCWRCNASGDKVLISLVGEEQI